jgi:hypothetical protein
MRTIEMVEIFTGTHKLAFSFPNGLFSQLFEPPIGQQNKPSLQV